MKHNVKRREFITKYFIFAAAVCVIFSAVSVILPAYSGEMINSVMRGDGDVWKYILFFAGIGLIQYILSVLRQVTEGFFQSSQKRRMRAKAFSFFLHGQICDKEKRAEAVSFVNNDIPVIVDEYYLGYSNLIALCSIIGITVTALFAIHWILAVIIVASSLLIVLIPHSHKKGSACARSGYSTALSAYNSCFISFLDGMNLVRVFKYFGRAFACEEEKNKDTERAERNVLKYQWIVYNWTAFVQIAKNVLLLIMGVLLIRDGRILVGDLIAVIQLAELIGVPIETLAYVIQSMNAARPLRDRYVVMLTDAESKPDVENLPGGEPALEIKDLSYQIDGISILNGVNMRFEGKKKYLLMGESGSGKSTLLKLIAGLESVDYSGTIAFNGIEIRNINKDSLYDRLAIAFQEPYLFNASLKENILLGREIDDDDYNAVIGKLNLQYLLDRYEGVEVDAAVMDKLSGGEKQRIALARTLIGKPDVYLFDEVTSSLDKQNAELIENVLLNEDAMVINVSHRTDPAKEKLYDCVIRMNAGEAEAL